MVEGDVEDQNDARSTGHTSPTKDGVKGPRDGKGPNDAKMPQGKEELGDAMMIDRS